MILTVLLGINSSQVWSVLPHCASFDAHRSPSSPAFAAYYRAFPHDRKLYRYLVGFLWCVIPRQRASCFLADPSPNSFWDYLHSAISLYTVYYLTVTHYAQPAFLAVSPWSFTIEPAMTGE